MYFNSLKQDFLELISPTRESWTQSTVSKHKHFIWLERSDRFFCRRERRNALHMETEENFICYDFVLVRKNFKETQVLPKVLHCYSIKLTSAPSVGLHLQNCSKMIFFSFSTNPRIIIPSLQQMLLPVCPLKG